VAMAHPIIKASKEKSVVPYVYDPLK